MIVLVWPVQYVTGVMGWIYSVHKTLQTELTCYVLILACRHWHTFYFECLYVMGISQHYTESNRVKQNQKESYSVVDSYTESYRVIKSHTVFFWVFRTNKFYILNSYFHSKLWNYTDVKPILHGGIGIKVCFLLPLPLVNVFFAK